ncbi:hypothetical protein [Arachidicoccus soli]|uniref:hypothetical protein n=1 Tax=Arachidicoccus soli TaxID=2341117 RepID=UPI0013C425E2|nr:hypothetical protein [Arachidicoccus soli]
MSDTSLHIAFDTSYYLTGRRDTLILSINSVSNGILAFNEAKTLVLVISNNCPLILSEYGGFYDIVKDPWADFIQNGYTNTIVTIVNDSTLSFPSPLTKAPIFVKINRLTNELSANDIDGSSGSYGKETVAVTNSGGVALNYITSPCAVVKMIYLNLTYTDPTYGVNANYI